MSMRLTCPGCGRSLLLPDDCTAELLSCPRCLANIPSPRVAVASAAVQTAPSPPPPAAPPSGVRRAEDWLPPPPVDVDVRRDYRRTGALSIVLAVFGGIGVSYALFLGFAVAQQARTPEPLLVLVGALAAFTAISALMVFVRRPSETVGANIGRTILGVLTISGAIVAVGSLLLAALIVFALVVCLANGGKC
jgi:hypothetical protein